MPMNSLKSKIRLADFKNQHCKCNSSVLLSQQLIVICQQLSSIKSSICIMQSMKSPGASPSFSQSPLLPCVLIQQLHVRCCGCDVNFYDFFYVFKKLQHWWPLLILDSLLSQSTSQCAYQRVMD